MSEDAIDFVALLTVWTVDSQFCNGAIFQASLRLSLKDGRWKVCISSLSIFTLIGMRMVLVLLGVNSKALGHEINLNAFNVLYETSDWWEQLLHDVPIDIWYKLATRLNDFVKGESLFLELRWICSDLRFALFFISLNLFADDVSDKVANKFRLGFALFDKSVSNNDVRQALEVGVVFRSPCQLLRNHIQRQVECHVLHLAANVGEVVVENHYNLLSLLAGKNFF